MLTTEMIQNLYEGSYEQDELNPYDAAGNIVDTVPGAVALCDEFIPVDGSVG